MTAEDIQVTTVDPGIVVVTERMRDVRSLALSFWVGTGSRDEEPKLAGGSHFLEHLLFKGTDRWSAIAIAEAIDAAGGEMNAFTTKDHTVFHVRLLDECTDLALDIMSDIFWSASLRPADVDQERQVIIEEILMHFDELGDLVHDVLSAALYPNHPLADEVLGTEQSIEAMARDDIVAFFAHHYRPENLVVAAAGNLDHAHIAEGIKQRFAGKDGGSRPQRSAPVDPPLSRLIQKHSTEQAHIAAGMRALPQGHPDRYALSLLEQIVGGGMSSRLFQEIREKRGLAYSVYAYRASFQETGSFNVYAGTAPETATEVVQIMRDELDKLAADGTSEKELDIAKGQLRGSVLMSVEDSGERMTRIGKGQLLQGEVLTVEEVLAKLDAVTHDDMARLCRDVLGSRRALAVVGPFDEGAFEREWEG